MRKTLPYILILFILLAGLFNPIVKVNVQAAGCTLEGVPVDFDETKCKAQGGQWTTAGAEPYVLLAPLPNVDATFDPKEPGALGKYLNVMITTAIGLAAVMAVVMIVMGGIEYMTSELISSKESGKEKITNALVGLLIALGAYAILYTINPDLLNTDLSSLKTVTVQVDLEADVPQTYDRVTKKYPNGATFGNKWDDSVGSTLTPLPAGVIVVNAECTTIGEQNCTSRRGLNLDIVNNIKSNCSNCGTLTIRGGTESWLHGGRSGNTSHQRNSSTVDLRLTTELTKYITDGQSPVIMERYVKNGVSFLYEGNHWHAGP